MIFLKSIIAISFHWHRECEWTLAETSLVYGYLLPQVAYFGAGSQALAHFGSRGLHCTLHFNPVDYMCKCL